LKFGIDSTAATDLALNGLGDLWQYSDFESKAFEYYGRTKPQIFDTYDNYTKNSKELNAIINLRDYQQITIAYRLYFVTTLPIGKSGYQRSSLLNYHDN